MQFNFSQRKRKLIIGGIILLCISFILSNILVLISKPKGRVKPNYISDYITSIHKKNKKEALEDTQGMMKYYNSRIIIDEVRFVSGCSLAVLEFCGRQK